MLLFNKAGSAETAARIHDSSCPLVAAARNSRGRIVVIEGESMQMEIEDLNERAWAVKICKCVRD